MNTWRHHTGRVLVTAAAAALGLLAAPPTPTRAQTIRASGDFTSTAYVIAICTVETSPLAFGAYEPVVTHATAPLLAVGAVTITCLPGTVAPIGLDLGANAIGNVRRMYNAAGPAYLTYEIFKDTGRTQVWGNADTSRLTPAAAPNGNPRSFVVYGIVPAGQDVVAGSYADTVLATVYF